jgi:hypothetical protein
MGIRCARKRLPPPHPPPTPRARLVYTSGFVVCGEANLYILDFKQQLPLDFVAALKLFLEFQQLNRGPSALHPGP